MKKPSLALVVNFAGLEADQLEALFTNLDNAIQVFSLASAANLRLIYACFGNEDQLRRVIAERFSGRLELFELNTAVRSNVSVVINRLLKHCFIDLESTVCMINFFRTTDQVAQGVPFSSNRTYSNI